MAEAAKDRTGLPREDLNTEYYGNKKISAPRIDMTWDFKGYPVDKAGNPLPIPPPLMPLWLWRLILKAKRKPPLIPLWMWWRILNLDKKPERADKKPEPGHDWRADEPSRRKPQEIYKALRHRWLWMNVMLPHVLAVLLGSTLFILALLSVPLFRPLRP